MKYDYYVDGKKYPSKVEALEFCKANIKKKDFQLVRKVSKNEEVIIPSVKEFLKTGIAFKVPTISPKILASRPKKEIKKVETKKVEKVEKKVSLGKEKSI